MRQGNDQDTQYRSGIYYINSEHMNAALSVLNAYQKNLHQMDWWHYNGRRASRRILLRRRISPTVSGKKFYPYVDQSTDTLTKGIEN